MYQNIATTFYLQTKDAPNNAPTTPFEYKHGFILYL